MEMLIMSWSVLMCFCQAGLWTVDDYQWVIFSILSYPQCSPVGRGVKMGEEMKIFDTNKPARDWTLVANRSHPLTCLSQHSCSARLYWLHLPAEFTTTAFEFTSPISSSPGPNVAPTRHPQYNSSYFIQITDIQFGFPSLCLWHKWPPLEMCSVIAQVPSCPSSPSIPAWRDVTLLFMEEDLWPPPGQVFGNFHWILFYP